MPTTSLNKSNAKMAADIIRDAGGQVVGRTRLQKIAYLLEITGLGTGFEFEYRHYGPFSEDLANGVEIARFLNLVEEEERTAVWGGQYSIFKTRQVRESGLDPARKAIIELGTEASPISLELAATAAFLATDEHPDPWVETTRRKPEKAAKCLNEAKALYAKLRSVNTPKPLPAI